MLSHVIRTAIWRIHLTRFLRRSDPLLNFMRLLVVRTVSPPGGLLKVLIMPRIKETALVLGPENREEDHVGVDTAHENAATPGQYVSENAASVGFELT